MDDQERAHAIQNSIDTKTCAACHVDLTTTGIVGSGSFADGLFCSLTCYAKFLVKPKSTIATNSTQLH